MEGTAIAATNLWYHHHPPRPPTFTWRDQLNYILLKINGSMLHLKPFLKSSLVPPVKWIGPVTSLSLQLGGQGGATHPATLMVRCLSSVTRDTPSNDKIDQRNRLHGSVNNFGAKSYFAELPLDRAAVIRKDAQRLRTLLSEPGSRTVLFCGNKAVVKESNAVGVMDMSVRYSLALWHPHGDSDLLQSLGVDMKAGFIFLGLAHDSGHALFACAVANEDALLNSADHQSKVCLIDVRTQGQYLTRPDASILALASGLLTFNRKTKYSPVSGNPLIPIDGGHALQEENCKIVIYPRLDPAVIVGVTFSQEWLLLGRKSSWIEGRYSLLAGFAEIGETLEGAVAREVEEEAGVTVDPVSIRYCGSQPWPFPQSLMIGFVAEAAATESGQLPKVEVDDDELEDARWFHRSWLQKRLSGERGSSEDRTRPFMIPGPYAIGHHIIWDWVFSSDSNTPHLSEEFIPDVAIDMDEGSPFKYVLIQATFDCGELGKRSKLLVRGDSRAEYHDHIFQATKREVKKHKMEFGDIDMTVLGGGRMQVSKSLKRNNSQLIKIYGYSAAFGQAPHSLTADVLRRVDPFLDIEVSYDGY